MAARSPNRPDEAHERVLALLTDKSGFLPLMHTAMLTVHHAWREAGSRPQRGQIQHAIETYPLATIVAPGLTAEGFVHAARRSLLQETTDVGKPFRRECLLVRLQVNRFASINRVRVCSTKHRARGLSSSPRIAGEAGGFDYSLMIETPTQDIFEAIWTF